MWRTIYCGLLTASLLFTTTITHSATLEIPNDGIKLSGIGFIAGWKCDAGDITVTINGGGHIPLATEQPRIDTRLVCGDVYNGFITQVNWNRLGDGEHTIVAYDDGIEFDQATFTVATTGEEFVRGANAQVRVEDFPSPGETTLFEWQEGTQHLEMVSIFGEREEEDTGDRDSTGETSPVTGRLGMEMVWIDAGTFMMGSNRVYNHDERPIHQVTISRPFYLGKYEVTQGEWNALMDENPSYYPGCDACPVTGVEWAWAQEFIRRLNVYEGVSSYRLPTEAEWEYAARANGTTYTPFNDYAWCGVSDGYRQAPVGQKKPNKWGLYDMLGNAKEWVQDWYGLYPDGPVTDPTGADPGYAQIEIDDPSYTAQYYRGKINRGGARNYTADSCTVSFRYSYDDTSGFRVAKTIAGQ